MSSPPTGRAIRPARRRGPRVAAEGGPDEEGSLVWRRPPLRTVLLAAGLAACAVVGPILLGLSKPVQICPLSASVSTILNMATLCAYEGVDG